MKKVLFINPPGKVRILDNGKPAHRKHCTPSLSLAYLTTSLLENDYEVEIVDMIAEGYDNEKIVDGYVIYGLDNEELLERIEKFKPDIIGISFMFTFTVSVVKDICNSIKKNFDIPIILGGYHASGAPVDCLKDKNVDYVMAGESDFTILEFMEFLDSKREIDEVQNLYYRKDNEIIHTSRNKKSVKTGKQWAQYRAKEYGIPTKLDELKRPAWHKFPMECYWNTDVRVGGGDAVRKKYGVLLSSRGCPHTCFYCTSPLVSGYKGYRRRSNENILAEIRWLVDEYDIEEFGFLDDNFFVDKKEVKKLLKLIAIEFPNIMFTVPGGTEVNKLDYEMVDLLAEANFYKALVAVEAADQTIQDNMIDKQVDISHAMKMSKYMQEKGIEVRGQFMIGFPGETKEQIKKTTDMARNSFFDDFYISIVTPMPGTQFYDDCIDNDLLIDDFDLENIQFSKSNIKLPDTTPEELEAIRRDVWHEEFEKKRQKMKVDKQERHSRHENTEEYEEIGFKSLK